MQRPTQDAKPTTKSRLNQSKGVHPLHAFFYMRNPLHIT